ncbi:MAG: hypothetical protein ACO3JL_22075, partial [Myxococcota bacterium]
MTTENARLQATIVALFPESLHGIWDCSILQRARRAGVFDVDDVPLREFATDKHRTVDDTPSGGGPGQVLRIDVVVRALREAVARDERRGFGRRRRIVL